MYQGRMRNNRAHLIGNQWNLFWNGAYSFMAAEEAMRFNEQEPLPLLVAVKELTGHALAWAIAVAVGYEPFLTVDVTDGVMLGGGQVQMPFEDQVVIAHFDGRKRYGPFRPCTDYIQGGPLLDKYRVSTEIAGDGWGALVNDTFCAATQSKVIHGDTRLEAGLRAIAAHFLGPVVQVPAEVVAPDIRRRLLAA